MKFSGLLEAGVTQSGNLARRMKMLLQILMITSLVQGVQGQTMNERNIGIIVGAIGGAIVIVLIVLACCILCRPKDRRRKQGTPSVFVNGGVYGNGTLPVGKPGVWTTNPTFFVGVPSPAYSATAGKKPVLAYRHSVAGRPYNGYTHLNSDKRNGVLPIYSQPDLRGSLTMEERRRQGILVDSNSSMVRAYSDYNGNKQMGPPGERYIAKVYSGYGDPSSHGNVARVYSNYSTPDLRMHTRHQVYPDSHVARAVVRQRDGTLDRIDEYTDVTASTPAVHVPYSNLSNPRLNRPVTRTQSYQDRQSPSRHLRPGSLIRQNAQSDDISSTANGFPGHKPLDRSSSDAVAHANRRLERQPLDDPHSKVMRTRSDDQQTRQFAPLPKPPTQGDSSSKDSVKSNAIDAQCDIHSPIYASLGEATGTSVIKKTNQTSSAVQRTSITEEDPNALYALPMKIKRPQTEGGSGRSQFSPEGQSPSPPPPPPPPLPPPLRPISDSKPEPPEKLSEASEEAKKDNEVKESSMEERTSSTKGMESSTEVRKSSTEVRKSSTEGKESAAEVRKSSAEVRESSVEVKEFSTEMTSPEVVQSTDLQITKVDVKGAPTMDSTPDDEPNIIPDSNTTEAAHKHESDSESITYAKAGEQITSRAFEFLDSYAIDDSSSVNSNNFDETSLTGCEMTDQLFGFLDSYPDVTCDTFGAEAHGSFSSSSQETIVHNSLPGGDVTPDILLDHGRVTLEVFKFLDEFEDE